MYREWLGIANPAPSYYGLLGLPELETDDAAVLGAGRRVKRKVRAYQIGLYRKQALDLLAEIGQAVSVLTNAQKKKVYDGELMARWKGAVEELYQTHCNGEAKDPDVLEAWLTACRARGVPVTRLMPYIMQTLTKRVGDWPASGDHGLGLPINLWIYRDAVILGQCLHVGALEKRIEAVKQAQKLLTVPEGLARLVAEEVGQAQHLFARARLVAQGRENPEDILLRLGRRIRRFGGNLGDGAVLAAVAGLLGVDKEDLGRAMGRMDERPVELSAGQAASVAARRARERIQGIGDLSGQAAAWVKHRPQILIGVAVVVGVAALAVAVLVAAGVIQLGQSEPPPPPAVVAQTPTPPPAVVAQTPTPPPPAAVAQTPTPPKPAAVAQTPTPPASPRPQPRAEQGPPDWLKELQKKYPVARPKPPAPPVPPVQVGDPPPSEVKFFGVKGDKRGAGAPVEVQKKPRLPRKGEGKAVPPAKVRKEPRRVFRIVKPSPGKPSPGKPSPEKPKPPPTKPPSSPKPPPTKPPSSPKPPPTKPPPSGKASDEDEQNAKRLLIIAETLETMPGAWKEDAIKAYENVVKSFPETAAAGAAKEALLRLRGAKAPAGDSSGGSKKTP